LSKTTVAAALRQRRRLTREPGASPQDPIAHPLPSAEGALEFGDAFSIPNELLSNVNRAFSAGAHLGVMSPGALPRANSECRAFGATTETAMRLALVKLTDC